MPALTELSRLSEAEDFFEFFGLPYDPLVLAAWRLQILRRFAQELAREDRLHPGAGEEERLARYRAALSQVHQAFACGGAAACVSPPAPRAVPLVTLARKG